MFNPTKSHEKEIQKGQYKIRMGGRVPKDAVNLAYSYVTPLNPNENVQIADTSGFILENVAANGVTDIRLWPDETYLLRTLQGQSDVYSQTFLLTSVFKDDVPLYFSHRLKYLHYDTQGPDEHGLYQGKAIIIVGKNGEKIGEEKKAHIVLTPSGQENLYKVDIYTSFQTKPGEEYKIIYNAVDFNTEGERTILTGFSERLNAQSAFTPRADIYEVTTPEQAGETIYYRAQSADFGYSKVYVPVSPKIDTRTPKTFQYRIKAEVTVFGGTVTIYSPWIGASVLNTESLTELDTEYKNGFKRLGEDSAEDIMLRYFEGTANVALLNTSYVAYGVESSIPEVEMDVKADGKEPAIARTSTKTGNVTIPLHYRLSTYEPQVQFSFDIMLRNKTTAAEHQAVRVGPFKMTKADGEVDIKTINYAEWLYPPDYDENNYEVFIRLSSPTAPVTLSVWNRTTDKGYASMPVPASDFQLASTINVAAKVTETRMMFSPIYSLRPTDNAQIRVLAPIAKGSKESWFLRIKNGRFYRSYIDQNNTPQGYGYFLPEYYAQAFDDTFGIPYKLVKDERPQVVGERQIKVRYTPLFIKVNRDTGKPENITVMVNNVELEIKAWDAAEGIIELAGTVRESDRITVDYYYEETAYEYRGYYDTANNHFWYLDLNPGKGHFSTQYDKESDEIKDLPSFGLINKTIYMYIKPAGDMTNITQVLAERIELSALNQYTLLNEALRIFKPRIYLKYADTDIPHVDDAAAGATSWEILDEGYIFKKIRINNPQFLLDDYYAIDYSYIGERYRFINGTFKRSVLFHSFEEIKEPNTILLGKIQVRPNSARDGVTLIDTRSRGGGLLAEIGQKVINEIMPEANAYWDIGFWDGTPYSENGVVIIKLPQFVLKEYGGRHTKQEVESAVEKHMAFGIFYIIEYLEEPLALIEIPKDLVVESIDIPDNKQQVLLTPEFVLITE